MKSQLSIGVSFKQEQKVCEQQLLSTRLLQMNSEALNEYVNTLLEENPVLERETPEDSPAEEALPSPAAEGTEPGALAVWQDETDTLAAFLLDQLERLRIDRALFAVCRYLVLLLDEDGFLPEDAVEQLCENHVPVDVAEQALRLLQSLEPAGVAARSLPECLCLQLRRRDPVPVIACAVAEHCLTLLSQKRYARIAARLRISEAQVRQAEVVLAALDPCPGAAFARREEPHYIIPDLIVEEQEGMLRPRLNSGVIPQLTLNGYYKDTLRADADPATRSYLDEKLRQANWLLYGLRRRGSTLLRCAEVVVETQSAFLRGDSDALEPLGMAECAQRLGMNISTVSRCVSGKYLLCRRGTLPLRFFFSRSRDYDAGRRSNHAIEQLIRRLVAEENPASPFSDQRISELLAASGLSVARRTVAKYREQLHIPPSHLRRKRD